MTGLLFEMRGIRWGGMLLGLLLLCVSVFWMPAIGSAATAVQVFGETAEEAGEVMEPVADASAGGNSDREERLQKRLLTVVVVGGVILLLLTVVYGYFRLELITRGFYSGRLQVLSVVASLIVVTAAYFLWRWLIR